ncbi:MAG: hypothetical protein ACTHKS_05235 [Gaiellaceae bacterium]
MTLLAFSRPFLPLFLHVLGAMTLFGVMITAILVAVAGRARASFTTLLIGIPAWIVAWVGAIWIEGKEDLPGDPAWIGIGHIALEFPLILCLLPSIFFAYRWKKKGSGVAQRIIIILSSVYLLALTVAMLAMSGKWGS